MQQPPNPSIFAPMDDGKTAAPRGPAGKNMKAPKPHELVYYYESRGMNRDDAALKVIGDLQTALYRFSSGNKEGDRSSMENARKLDKANAQLTMMEMKLDSKPGYRESLAIGVMSGAALKGIGAVLPTIFGGVSRIWSAVGKVADGSSGSA